MTLWLPLLAASLAAAEPAFMSVPNRTASGCDPSAGVSCPRDNKIVACGGREQHPDEVFANIKKAAQQDPTAIADRSLWQKMTFQKAKTAPIIKVDEYLTDDSPALATKDENGDPEVKVAGAAFDCTVDDSELAFVAGHELRHTIMRQHERECLRHGVKANGGNQNYLKYQDKRYKAYKKAVEQDADLWGQWYAFTAGYDPAKSVDAIDHLGDLMEGMGADMAADDEHPSIEQRRRALQGFANNATPPALDCPWKDE